MVKECIQNKLGNGCSCLADCFLKSSQSKDLNLSFHFLKFILHASKKLKLRKWGFEI